jgi:hypothetical protein
MADVQAELIRRSTVQRMIARRLAAGLVALAVAAALSAALADRALAEGAPAADPNSDRIAVLITDWAEPEGFDPLYRREVVKRSFGARASAPNAPCTQNFFGTFPFRVQLGLTPFAVGFAAPGLEGVHDSIGLYRLSADGQTYVSIYDPKVTVAASAVPATPGMITPAKDVKAPLQRSLWAIDPRDGTNYLDGVFMIGAPARGPGPNPLAFPNGIRDADEYSYAAGITDFSVLHEDLTPRLSRATLEVEHATGQTLAALFGDRVDVRSGAYAPTEGLTRFEEDVALDFYREGFRRMVLVRETTDNNNYANNVMTRGYIERALCLAGHEGQVQFQQSRQVGRTPEYNLALLHIAKKNLDNVAPGSEVAILYTTYGLPFPDRAAPGPFSAPHPWSKEVYHENAYNNYISFKRYLEAYYGDRYRLQFNPVGASGDKRLDNYYSYGLSTPADFTAKEPENRFRTLRENIDQAKKDGRRQHHRRAVALVLQRPRSAARDPRHAEDPAEHARRFPQRQVLGRLVRAHRLARASRLRPNDPTVHYLQYSETFDSWAREFGIGYAQNIRSAVERFGVFPATTNLDIVARGAIDREGGGSAEVKSGPLRGARVVVAADKYPGEPERFDAQDYRAFTDPADNLVSAWDSFEAYIGTQDAPVSYLAEHSQVVSPAVLFGPYRTIVNRPATFTLPLTVRKLSADEAARLRVFVYNEVSRDWDPVFTPAGSAPPRWDPKTRTVSFDTQVFGVFAAAITPPGWTVRSAIRHRYHQTPPRT